MLGKNRGLMVRIRELHSVNRGLESKKVNGGGGKDIRP